MHATLIIFVGCIIANSIAIPQPDLDFIQTQVGDAVKQVQDPWRYPSNSKVVLGKDLWETTDTSAWTCGFFPAIFWKLFNITDDATWVDYALDWTMAIEAQQFNKETHDVGFMVFYSFGHAYEITGNDEYKDITLNAARSLTTRYSPIVGCIRSWNGPNFQVIIDNMMNLEILWWASTFPGYGPFRDMAISHSDKMIKDCIKEDGSSYHLIVYNETDGAVISRSNTPQGFPNGVWSRGQAWAIYGFTMAYRYTKFDRYLTTAMQCAKYYISHVMPDQVPLWDFAVPSNSDRDSSAGAIAASALIELASYVTGDMQTQFRSEAERILASLKQDYLGIPTQSNAILMRGTIGYQMPMNVSLIYGDYFYIEALHRLDQFSHP